MNPTQYFKDVRSEMHHVSWPTRQQTIIYTSVVIGISLVTAAYLGLFDYLFSAIIQKVI
jgi:preprotein translocase SecE subunit